MGLLEKIATRRNYPLELDTGNTIKLCAPETGEIERADVLPDKLKTGFLCGCCLCEDNGEPAFPKTAGESDEVFAARVKKSLDDAGVRVDTMLIIMRAIGRLGTVDREAISKN